MGRLAQSRFLLRQRRKRSPGPELGSSGWHRLAQKRNEGGEIRRERRKERGRNLKHPWDFGVRAISRASGKSPMVGGRTSANQGHCGRHTSQCGSGKHSHTVSIPSPGVLFKVGRKRRVPPTPPAWFRFSPCQWPLSIAAIVHSGHCP
jgi:hypothetical protein